jgi:hypothetical protein
MCIKKQLMLHCLVAIVALTSGCATLTLKDEFGMRPHYPDQCCQAFLHEHQIIISYITFDGRDTADAWLAIPVSFLRNDMSDFGRSIPASSCHAGKLPDNVRSAAQPIPLILLPTSKLQDGVLDVSKLRARALDVLSKETTAVAVPEVYDPSEPLHRIYIRYTHADGESIVMLALCPIVIARSRSAEVERVLLFPAAVALDILCSPIELAYFILCLPLICSLP